MNYLYNGVELPALPELPYKYAVIEYAEVDAIVSGGRLARLICSSEPIIFNPRGFPTTKHCLLGDVVHFGFANHDAVWGLSFGMVEPYPPINEWVKIGEEHFDERTEVGMVVSASRPKWANHDVIRNDSGIVFLAASDPIPVGIDPEIDPFSMTLGWLAGSRIAGQRGRTTATAKEET